MTEWLERVRSELSERYRIDRELGRGSTATVYLADDLVQQRQVAVKVLHPELVQAVGGQRFLREIRVAASLHHPHLLAIHDSGEANGLFYFVAPYLPDGSLRTLLNRERQLSVDEALRITREIADALSYVHEHGIVHRDVKPENILFARKHACVADFGIARAIDIAVGDTLTSTGLVVGTPAYMSPEQASGERAVDARSDQYSLACVLYELLAGVPPFVGATAQSVISQRFAHAPSPLTFYRPNVAPGIESAVARSLSIAPADRFDTVGDFVAALDRRAPPVVRIDPAVRLRKLQRRWFMAGASAALVIIALFGFSQARERVLASRRAALDTTRFVVLPFPGSSGGTVLSREGVTHDVHSALREWNGISLIDEAAARDLVAGVEVGKISRTDAIKAAAAAGAGRLVWGQLIPAGSATAVRVALYDVGAGRAISEAETTLTRATEASTAVTSLAHALLRARDLPPDVLRAQAGTRELDAWRAYERGHFALRNWDLGVAEREFGRAIAADPDFAAAQLWVAQLRAWLDREHAARWRDASSRAVAARLTLSERESALAGALAAMAREAYPEACAIYGHLLKQDSADVVAWYGLGECQEADATVVPSPSSPSRWAFRSSFHRAANAYLRAVQIEPRAYALPVYKRLSAILRTQPRYLRRSHGNDFGAYATMRAETLAFVPYPREALARGSADADPEERSQALIRNGNILLDAALEWARVNPRSPSAFDAIAEVREARFELDDKVSRGPSAIVAVRHARRLAGTRQQQLKIAAREVRLLLKRREYRSARLLVDSLLTDWPDPTPEAASQLRGLAVLTGKLSRGSRLHALAEPELIVGGEPLPAPVANFVAQMQVRLALGVCEGYADGMAQLDALADRYSDQVRAAQAKRELAAMVASDAVVCTRGRSALSIAGPHGPIVEAQQAYARGDYDRARTALEAAASGTRGVRPGEASLEYTLEQAWLRAALGDATGSARLLDLSLTALPTQAPTVTTRIRQAGALPRAMLLRAELANATRDTVTARYWLGVARVLWETADPLLQNRIRILEAALGVQK